jgi:hypothetical protein
VQSISFFMVISTASFFLSNEVGELATKYQAWHKLTADKNQSAGRPASQITTGCPRIYLVKMRNKIWDSLKTENGTGFALSITKNLWLISRCQASGCAGGYGQIFLLWTGARTDDLSQGGKGKFSRLKVHYCAGDMVKFGQMSPPSQALAISLFTQDARNQDAPEAMEKFF